MKIELTEIPDLYTITPSLHKDNRGHFFRYFCKEEMLKAGLTNIEFVQMNESFNEKAGTFRGFHFQKPPFLEDKLIRCVKGSVMDFAIDLRKGSPTFLKYFSIELNEDNHKMIYIPKGFGHGFITMKPGTILIYHHTVGYQPGFEGGIRFDDPMVGVVLPRHIESISEKDEKYAYLTPEFKGLEI